MLCILFSLVENREYCSNRMFFPLYLHLSSLHSAEIRKKNVTFNWTCGDMFQLRKICDAWKVAHLSEMTQKARCDCVSLLCCATTAGSSRCLLRSAGCSVKAAVTPLPWEQREWGESRACPCPLPAPLPTDAPQLQCPAWRQQQFAAPCVSLLPGLRTRAGNSSNCQTCQRKGSF